MPQLIDGKAQSHQLTQGIVGAVHLTLDRPEEGQIQAGKQGSGSQRLRLVVTLGAVLLHWDMKSGCNIRSRSKTQIPSWQR